MTFMVILVLRFSSSIKLNPISYFSLNIIISLWRILSICRLGSLKNATLLGTFSFMGLFIKSFLLCFILVLANNCFSIFYSSSHSTSIFYQLVIQVLY